MNEAAAFDKLDQMLADGSITEDDYHRLWNAIRAKPGIEKVQTGRGPNRLTRKFRDGRVCGVCAGFGEYFHVDPMVIRAVFLLTFPLLGLFAGFSYILLAVMLPWDEPERAMSFRKEGKSGRFIFGLVMILVVTPTVYSLLVLPNLFTVYEGMGLRVWSSPFQNTIAGRAIDCISEYGNWWTNAIPLACVVIAPVTALFYVFHSRLCNARFRKYFSRTLITGASAWLMFLIAGSLAPLIRQFSSL